MPEEERSQSMEQVILSFFRVNDLFTCSVDSGFKAEMKDKLMAYGMLLRNCGLMNMTEDQVEKKIKEKLNKFSKVRIRLEHQINNITYFSLNTLPLKNCHLSSHCPANRICCFARRKCWVTHNHDI